MESESQISIPLPEEEPRESSVRSKEPRSARKKTSEVQSQSAASEGLNQREMQTLKYIRDGGTLIKRNLFDEWVHIYEKEVNFLNEKEGGPKQGQPIAQEPGRANVNLFNLKFDRKVHDLVFSKMQEYQTFVDPSNHGPAEHIYSVCHLKKGIFITAGSDNLLKIRIPGRSQKPNYLGCLEEDSPVSNLQVFGQHARKNQDKELQVIYTSGLYIKLLSFKKLTSVIVYKNLKEITCLCIVQQNKNILSFGTCAGAIKDYDMKSKKVVRIETKRHAAAITCIVSFGKYLVSCSPKDNMIVVYDYQLQEEYRTLSLDPAVCDPSEQPQTLACFKDGILSKEYLLIGTTFGNVYLYDIEGAEFKSSLKKPKTMVRMKSQVPIVQIIKNPQTDKQLNCTDVFTIVSSSGQVKLVALSATDAGVLFKEIKDLQRDMSGDQPVQEGSPSAFTPSLNY